MTSPPLRIVIPGGSGQVGTVLARAFHRDGHRVAVLSRQPKSAPWRTVAWDGRSLAGWVSELDGADVVINLAGRSVNCRYGAKNRRDMMDSRIRSTEVIGRAIARSAEPPKTWLQASTATIYAHRFDAANDEVSGRIGGTEPGVPALWKFSIDIAQAWERACLEANTPNTRRVLMRLAITMSPDAGGAFAVLLGHARLGLGGRAASGRQFVSWIHHEDFVRAVSWLIARKDVSGVVNLASPNPLPWDEFMRELCDAAGIRIRLPTPAWLLEIGAALLRTETELLLKSRRVVPTRLLSLGFDFRYPQWRQAAKDLCQAPRGRAHPLPMTTPS